MKIEYRPAEYKKKLKPVVEAFFRLYELKGVSEVRVEPSLDKLTVGIMICPQPGSIIEEICTREVPAAGQLVRAGKEYVVLDIAVRQRCSVYFEYYESLLRK